MTPVAQVALLGFVPLSIVLFAVMPPHRALIWSWLLGYLFLPQGSMDISGLPDFGRTTAMGYGTLLGALLFAPGSFLRLRPSVWDVPMLVFTLAPAFSHAANGLTDYDVVISTVNRALSWMAPYLLARVFLNSRRTLREFAWSIVIAGLIYLPLCWYEIRMSPQLHRMVYGYQWRWQGMRLGGWRPQVFLHSGLPLGMWMTTVCFVSLSMWASQAQRRVASVPYRIWVVAIAVTTLLCRSLGALGILVIAAGSFLFSARFRARWALVALVLVPSLYSTRAYYPWRPDNLVEFVATHIDAQRAQSLEFRLHHEDLLIDKAMERPLFGWAGYGRNRVYDDRGRNISVTDGLWVIELGVNGLTGLVSVLLIHMIPPLLLMRRHGDGVYSPDLRPLLAVSLIPTLYMIDYLPNGFECPIAILAAGGVVGYCLAPVRAPSARQLAAAGEGNASSVLNSSVSAASEPW